MASNSSPSNLVIMDVHYKAIFVLKPLVYFEPRKTSVTDVVFSLMGLQSLLDF